MAQRILIADDESDFRDILKTVLLKAGYVVEIACGGREAIGAYVCSLHNNKPIDLILLDVRMPDVLGIEALTIIRDEERRRGIKKMAIVPVILMTAYDDPSMDTSLISGSDDYIVKSDSIEEILLRVKKRLA